MGKGYRKRKLKSILENPVNDIRFNKLSSVLNTRDCEKMIYLILDTLEDELYNYKNETNSLRMLRGIELSIKLMKKDKSIDSTKVMDMFYDLYDAIEDRIESHPEKYDTKDLKKVMYTLDELSYTLDVFDEEENKKYEFLKSVIFKNKNYYYLRNVINYFPDMINTHDLQGNSLICNVVMEYLKLIKEQTLNTDTYYFDKVIDILLSSKRLKFPEEDKKSCLIELCNILVNLKDKDQLYNVKRNLLINLKEDLLGTRKNKYRMKLLKEKYSIKEGFDRDVLEELKPDKKYQESIPKKEVDDYVISIDGDYAMEIDDALSAKKLPNGNYLLGVHIASVTSYFDFNSLIVQNAIERGENIYEEDKIISIFPKEYSSNKGSLLEGVPRFAESHYFEIKPNGEIVNEYLEKSIIHNSKKATYKEIAEVIEKGSYKKELETTVNNLVEITKIISQRYNFHSSLEKEPPMAFSHDIVEYSMVLHNESIANMCFENKYPIIYLTQEEKQELDEFLYELSKEICEGNSILHQQIFYYEEESNYALEGSHSGLKIEHYAQCSSPLRRCVDIINQRAIDLFYYEYGTDEERKKFREYLKTAIEKINKQKENINIFRKKTKKLKK